jgi:outer membrane protein
LRCCQALGATLAMTFLHMAFACNPAVAQSNLEAKATVLTLEQAINRALRANRSLADVADNVDVARLTLVASESDFELKIFPGAELGAAGGSGQGTDHIVAAGVKLQKKLTHGTEIAVTPRVSNQDGYRSEVGLRLTQPLLRGFSKEFNLAGVDEALFGKRTSRRQYYLAKVSTVLQTISNVYSVIQQKELMRLSLESAQRLQAQAEAARAKGRMGLVGAIDVYRAEIQLRQAQDELNTARESYEAALDDLRLLLALPLNEMIKVEAPLEYSLVKVDEKIAIQSALQNRVELLQANDALKEARRRSRVAEHNTLPDLDLVVGYSAFKQDDDLGRSISLDSGTWGVNLSTSTDLFRSRQKAEYEKSLLAVDSQRRAFYQQRDEITREVKLSLLVLRRAEKRIEIQKEQIKQAKRKLMLSKLRFQWGLANNFDVIESESELRRSQTSLLSAVLDYIVGSSRLRAAMGTLLERPRGI